MQPHNDHASVQAVSIGPHRVGPGARALMIAEAGVNHNGRVERAIELVDIAASAGADAVKFQMFRAADLVTKDAPTAAYQKKQCGDSSQRQMLTELELGDADFDAIQAHCDRRSLLFLATPFGPVEVRRLAGMGVTAIKIASTDLTNTPLLTATIDTGIPVILSTGASTISEMNAAVELFRSAGATSRLLLLHCVSCYPTPIDSLRLSAIAALARTYGVPAGLSDHSTSTQVGAWAIAAGACVIEKHFTLDRTDAGPDHAMSLDPAQLAEYIEAVRCAESAMANGALGMTQAEAPVRLLASRSVVAAVDIAVGTKLRADLLTLKRPGTGIPAAEMFKLDGQLATTTIPRDTILSWDMVR